MSAPSVPHLHGSVFRSSVDRPQCVDFDIGPPIPLSVLVRAQHRENRGTLHPLPRPRAFTPVVARTPAEAGLGRGGSHLELTRPHPASSTTAQSSSCRGLTISAVKASAPGGGYCLGSGNSIANYVPLENYLIMLDDGWKVGRCG